MDLRVQYIIYMKFSKKKIIKCYKYIIKITEKNVEGYIHFVRLK